MLVAASVGETKGLVNGKTKTFFGGGKEILDANLWEISETLGIARKETLNARNASITIFCDSQKAPKTIQQPRIPQENRFLRSFIYQKTGELQSNGHCLAIRWIPSHSGLLENEKSELKEAEDYLSIGVRLHISRRAWLMYVTRKLPSGTRQRCRKGKLVVAVIMLPGQRVVLLQYLETLQEKYASRYTSSR